VVWHDNRGATGLVHIWGARVSTLGALQDANGIQISQSANYNAENAAVASDGANFLVAWVQKNGAANTDIAATRVTSAGTVQDTTPPIDVCDAGTDQRDPRITYGGSSYFIAWTGTRSDPYGDIYGARVSSTGAVQDANGFPILANMWVNEYAS